LQQPGNLRDDSVGALINVRGSEAQKLVARAQDRVLAPKVLGHPLAMVATVVLDDQLRARVVEIGAEALTEQVDLHLGFRKSRLYQQMPQSRLHGRIGRLREWMKLSVAEFQCLVGEDQVVDLRQTALEIAERARH